MLNELWYVIRRVGKQTWTHLCLTTHSALVQTANSCIQNCQGDTTCYSNCIQQNWPTSIAPTASGVTMLPTASVTGTGTGLTSITATVPTTSQTTHTGTASATQTATSDALPNDPMTAFCSLLLAITLAMLIA